MLLSTTLLTVIIAAADSMNPASATAPVVTPERALLNRSEITLEVTPMSNLRQQSPPQTEGERGLLGGRGGSSVVFSVPRSREPVDRARAFLGR